MWCVCAIALGFVSLLGLSRALSVGWVVGVWFGFALRCVALLCGVFVRLHLALFPAGGHFLPSLCKSLGVKVSVKSFGRLGALALTLLGDLAVQAVQAGGPGLS
jgi:hypothetical protein